VTRRFSAWMFLAVLAIALGLPAGAAGPALSANEQLYAQLAKLPAAERTRRIEEGARREGNFVFIETWRGVSAREHMALFQKRYPWLKVEMSDMGSQDAASRFTAEETAGRHLTDELSLSIDDMAELLKNDLTARYPTPATAAILPQYRHFIDPQNRWTPWYWSEHGISYNTNLVQPNDAPKSWFDLCAPRFRGTVSYDPGETRFLVGLYTMLGDAGTQRLLKCIGENKPIVQRGHDQRMNLMLAGDHAVQGDNYIFEGVAAKREKPATPFAYVTTIPILAYGDGVVINRNAPHPYAAALYADWSVSPESQAYVVHILRGSVTQKHPYFPDDVKLVTTSAPSPELVQKLQGYWSTYVAQKL
jgi:iron(III) transport system substrate-binding protein